MGGLIDMEGARALVADHALWPRLRDFLWDFAPQVHPSWIEDLESSNVGKLEDPNPLTLKLSNSQTLKRFVLSSLGVGPCFYSFPKDDWSRLVLLDGGTLESLVKWLGALACADGLRGITDGKTVRALKTALPGVYPEVFGYTAYFKGLKIEDLGFKIEEGNLGKIGVAGCRILLSLLDSLPASLVARLKLKLPKAYSDASNPQSSTLNPQSSIFNPQSLTRLLKLKFPEAYSLCCS